MYLQYVIYYEYTLHSGELFDDTPIGLKSVNTLIHNTHWYKSWLILTLFMHANY